MPRVGISLYSAATDSGDADRNLTRCLALSTLIADERFQLYLEFVAATPDEVDTAPLGLKAYLSEICEASLASLDRGMGPVGVV